MASRTSVPGGRSWTCTRRTPRRLSRPPQSCTRRFQLLTRLCSKRLTAWNASEQRMRPVCRGRKFRPSRRSIEARETAKDKRSPRRLALSPRSPTSCKALRGTARLDGDCRDSARIYWRSGCAARYPLLAWRVHLRVAIPTTADVPCARFQLG